MQTSSGVPGASSKILIRGASSLNSSTEPLWIIDGVPLFSDDFTQNNGATSQSPMSLINQNDIESIQILKDAAATAIYGSRGTNGVIIVTTKTGKGRAATSIDYSTGISDLSRKPSDIGYVNTQQYFQALDRLYQSAGRPFTMDDYYDGNRSAFTKITRAQAESINTDWFDLIFRNGTYHDVNISTSKASEGTQFYISGNYRKDNGVQINNALQRASVRSNLDFNPAGIFSMGMKANLSYTLNTRQQNNGFVPFFSSGVKNGGLNAVTGPSLPWFPVYDPNNPKNYFNPYSGANPMAYADPANLKDELSQYRGIGGVYANLKIPFVPGLSLRSELSADFLQSNSTFYNSRNIYKTGPDSTSGTNYASDQAVTRRTINYNAYGTYDRSFGDHNINAVAGAEGTTTDAFFRSAEGRDLVGNHQYLGGNPGTILRAGAGPGGELKLGAYFGRANYKFKDRYLLGLSGRRDGTSTFGADYRWGTFLAYSAGWILSEEPFMKDILGGNTFLKLRASYGETGNQNIPGGLDQALYSGTGIYGGNSISGVGGTLPTNVPVKDITWETSKATDVAIDFGLLNSRISGSLGYYNKNIEGMLLTAPVALSAGIGGSNSIYGNLGTMSNSGVELELHSANMVKSNFRWTTDFNIAFNKNKVKSLTPDADQNGNGLTQGDGYWVSRKGEKRRQWNIAEYAGIDPQLGVPMIRALDRTYYNSTGNTRALKNSQGLDSLIYGTITNINNNHFIQEGKSPDPTYYGGVNNSFQYKGFEVGFLISFSGGNYIYDYSLQTASAIGPQSQFLSEVYAKSWRGPGDNTAEYPQMRIGGLDVDGTVIADFAERQTYNTKWLYKGDYIRLRNVRLGYSLPGALTKRIGVQGLNFSLTGTNLWTGTDYRGFDPEGAEFVQTAVIPQMKSVILGITAKF